MLFTFNTIILIIEYHQCCKKRVPFSINNSESVCTESISTDSHEVFLMRWDAFCQNLFEENHTDAL